MQHNAEVQQVGTQHQATCNCGWNGRIRVRQYDANFDAQHHKDRKNK